MYDGRRSRVKEVESVEYLRAPTTHDLDVDFLESTKVSKKKNSCHNWRVCGRSADVFRVPDVISSVTRMRVVFFPGTVAFTASISQKS